MGLEGVRIVKNENKIYFGEVLYRKKHGRRKKRITQEFLFTEMAESMKGNFSITKRMGMGASSTRMAICILVNSDKTKNMGKGLFTGLASALLLVQKIQSII